MLVEYGSAVGRQELSKSIHFVGMQTGQQQGSGLGVRGGITGGDPCGREWPKDLKKDTCGVQL